MNIDDYLQNNIIPLKIKNFENVNYYSLKRFKNLIEQIGYEKFTIKLFLRLLKNRDVFLDVGAFHGYYSILAAIIKKKIKIYAFEPVEENLKIFKKNIKVNKIKSIKVKQLAISNKSTLRDFYLSEASDSSSFSGHPLTPKIKRIKIKTASVDDLNIRKVDFIKIDTEGHEIEVLKGMTNTIKNNKNLKLIVEFNPKCLIYNNHQPEELIKELKKFFSIYLIDEESEKTYFIDENNWKRFIKEKDYKNLLCLPKGSLSIIFFSHSADLGGSERSLLELIDELLKKNVVITVVLPSDGPLKKLLDNRPISTIVIPFTWWAKINYLKNEELVNINSQSYYNLLNSLPELEAINPDLIYTNTVTIPWGAFTSILLEKPHIWHIREYGELDHNLHFDISLKKTKKIINATSNAIITNSKALKNFYKDHIDEKKITFAYNYIDIPKNLINYKMKNKIFRSKTSVKLLILGTIMPGKGQKDSLLALNELLKNKYKIELAIIGQIADKNYFNEISNFINKNKLSKYIHYHSFIDNIYPLIKKTDIVLICSKNEAFGRITVEAMLLKKAVIGTKTGATVELIKDKYNGLLYKPGDYKDLAKKIEYLITNKNKIKEFGQTGYNFIKKINTKKNYGGKIYQIIKKVKLKKPMVNLTPITSSFYKSIKEIINENKILLSKKSQQTEVLKKEIENLTTQLQKIQSSKTYKIWQGYCRIMKKLGLKR